MRDGFQDPLPVPVPNCHSDGPRWDLGDRCGPGQAWGPRLDLGPRSTPVLRSLRGQARAKDSEGVKGFLGVSMAEERNSGLVSCLVHKYRWCTP